MSRITEQKSEAALQAREELALEELRELGFRIALYEPRTLVEEDPLRGVKGGWKIGCCHVQASSMAGKLKTVTGISAVQALDEVKSWLHYQETRLAPDLRFTVSKEPVAVPVIQRAVGDTAETAQRRAEGQRRVISFDTGTPTLVDEQGTPIFDASQASQNT